MVLHSRNKNAGDLCGTVGGEEVEFYSDLRLARRWKRRRIGCGNFGSNATPKKTTHQTNGNNNYATVEIVIVDSDSEQRLDDVELSVDTDARCVGHADGDDFECAFDPHYMMFLANLKDDGKSYLLELALDNETPVVVEYEKDDGSSNKVYMDQKQGKITTEDALKSQLKREKTVPLKRTLRSNSGRVKTGNSKRSESTKRVLRSKSSRKDCENPGLVHDVKKDKTGIPRFLRDIGSQNYHSSSNGNGCSSSRHSPKAINTARRQCNRGVKNDDLEDENYKEFLRFMKDDGAHMVWRPEGGKKVVYEKSDSDSEAEKEAEVPVSSAENGCSGKRHIPEAANTKHQFNHGLKSDLIDESFQEFLIPLRDSQHHSEERAEDKVDDPLSFAQHGCPIKRHIPEAANAKAQFNHGAKSEAEEEEVEDPVSPVENVGSSKRPSPKASNSVKHQKKHAATSDLQDKSYLEFLKSVKDGQHLECTLEGKKKVIFEEIDSHSEAGEEAKDPVGSIKSQRLETTNSAKRQCNRAVQFDLVDESYQEFLKFLENGQHLEYTPEDGKKVTYEESDSESQVMILDTNPFSDGEPTPLVIDLDGEECIENLSGSKGSIFRNELMEILQKPYDRQEYEKLWQDASQQRPLQGVRILRFQNKSYPLDSNGKSYLQLHGDLASAINQAQCDNRRILNLLRGFFYWLQNVVREGSFKPWLDSSCLSTLPPVPLKASTSV